MFARTERLLLRPGWIDDARVLHDAMAHQTLVRALPRAPWPYELDDAHAYLQDQQVQHMPNSLVFLRTAGTPRLIGGFSLDTAQTEADLQFWISPAYWGLGFATEAGRAFIAAAQHSLRLSRLTAAHLVDNSAAGHVLTKLGFERTGKARPVFSKSRQAEVLAVEYALRQAIIQDEEERRHAPLLAA